MLGKMLRHYWIPPEKQFTSIGTVIERSTGEQQYAPVICWPRSRPQTELKRPARATASGNDYKG
jgi:hypothetical protein